MERSNSKAEAAQVLGLNVLAFLAGDDQRFQRFQDLSGLTPDDIAAQAGDPAFLGAVLDYILGWEPLLLDFAADTSTDPQLVVKLRSHLPGFTPY